MVKITFAILLPTVAVALVGAMDSAAAEAQSAGLHTSRQIEQARTKIAAGEQPWKNAFEALLEQADRSLEKPTEAVEDFNVPGFYDDPEGHRNALRTLAQDAWVAYACAVAYQLSPDALRFPYATKAVETLDAWATTNKQASGYDGNLVMAYAGVGLLFAAELLTDFEGWDDKQRLHFNQWVTSVFLPVCGDIVNRTNNWGDWALLGNIAGHAFLQDTAQLDADITLLRKKIEDAIHTDGSMPHETRREKRGMWYTYFALAPLTAACQIAMNARGVDLFHYKGAHGVGIEDALDYLFKYCNDPQAWPHYTEADLAHPRNTHWPGNMFEAMSGIYSDKAYENWVQDARPIMVFGHHYAWAVPTLLHNTPPPNESPQDTPIE